MLFLFYYCMIEIHFAAKLLSSVSKKWEKKAKTEKQRGVAQLYSEITTKRTLQFCWWSRKCISTELRCEVIVIKKISKSLILAKKLFICIAKWNEKATTKWSVKGDFLRAEIRTTSLFSTKNLLSKTEWSNTGPRNAWGNASKQWSVLFENGEATAIRG